MADLLTATIGGGSSILVAENRKSVFDATAVDFYGNKPLTFFTVDFVAAANAEIGANEAIQAVIEIIQSLYEVLYLTPIPRCVLL
jgi:hypothetical protein